MWTGRSLRLLELFLATLSACCSRGVFVDTVAGSGPDRCSPVDGGIAIDGGAASDGGGDYTDAGYLRFAPFGDGPASEAVFAAPSGLVFAAAQGKLYASELCRLREIDLTASVVSTLSGNGVCDLIDGPRVTAEIARAMGLAAGPDALYFMDEDLPTFETLIAGDPIRTLLRRVGLDGTVSTLAGGDAGFEDGIVAQAELGGLSQTSAPGLYAAPTGTVYFTDPANVRVRRLDGGMVMTLAGTGVAGSADGPGVSATFSSSLGPIVGDGAGNLWVGDGSALRQIDPQGNVTTFAGSASAQGHVDGPQGSARFEQILALARASDGTLYVAEGDPGGLNPGSFVRMVDPGGNVTTLAGNGGEGDVDGPASSAELGLPMAAALDEAGKRLFFADWCSDRIRVVTWP
ncbi:MAG: NHL repeat-containing protein [Deltaproteobacteria bacterium]